MKLKLKLSGALHFTSLERTLTADNLTLFSVMSGDHILISKNGSNGVDIGHDM